MFQNGVQSESSELNERQKHKIISTISEFVWLNNTLKPTQVKCTDDTNTSSSTKYCNLNNQQKKLARFSYKFTPRDPYNQLIKSKAVKCNVNSPQRVNLEALKGNSRAMDDFGSLFYQGDKNDFKIKQVSSGQYVIEINNDDNIDNDSNNMFFRRTNLSNSFDNPNGNSEGVKSDLSREKDEICDTIGDKEIFSKINNSNKHFLNSNKVMNKNRRIAAVMNENLNRKSESHAFWKNQLLENQESYENCPEQVISPTENKLSKMPSMETIRRSLSQINFECPKTSLNLSRVNSSSYNNKRLVKANKKTIAKLDNPNKLMKKRNLGKPFTTQHKSTKVSEVPVIYKKSRLQQNLDRVRSSGIQPVDSEIIYKYTLSKKVEVEKNKDNKI